MKCLPVYVTFFLFLYLSPVKAQLLDFLSLAYDSTCISDESDKLLLRVFAMQKFNKFTLGQNGIANNVTYRANDNYNIGIGGQYKWLGLNISFPMPFVNNDNSRLGDTKFFDLQSYLYLNSIAVDLFILSYKSYYMANSDILKNPPPDNDLLIRSDLRTGNYGLNLQYIFNSDRFSYRAAFLQNQCQMQSAGSVIAGGGVHYTRARADSAVIPGIGNDEFFRNSSFNKSTMFTMTVNAGYAYTQVIRRHFFITASALVGIGANYASLKTDKTNSSDAGLQGQLHTLLRGAAGYNTTDYFIGVQYYNYISRNNTPIPQTWQQLQAGNIRITYARRFKLKKKTVRMLEEIEDSIMPEM